MDDREVAGPQDHGGIVGEGGCDVLVVWTPVKASYIGAVAVHQVGTGDGDGERGGVEHANAVADGGGDQTAVGVVVNGVNAGPTDIEILSEVGVVG